MKNFINKNKKYIILFSVGLIFILVGVLSWNLYFSKYKQFSEQEKIFLESAQRYYSFNKKFLPKVGETREVTYKFLSENEHVIALYVPNTDKLCDLEKSWVRVYKNDKNEYEYTTYLKCGKFESNVDHESPVMKLKGDEQIVVSLNSNYEEPGVEKITDNKDGNIDISKVSIDSSNVDTSKVGTYKVTYTVRDKAYNKTVLTRKVIVAKNLTEIVTNDTDDTNYYRGFAENNYLLFSGMLFRIVNVNSDGTVKIISNENISNLRINHENYDGSNIDTWLQNVYYPILNKADKYLVSTDYCVGNINSMEDYQMACDKTVNRTVGTLNASEFQKTILNGKSYIVNGGYFALSNLIGMNYASTLYDNQKYLHGLPRGILAGIRPVMTLKSNLYVIQGNGSYENPYRLGDYSYADKNDLINTRLIGEYLQYSGIDFRIIGIDSNKNVRIISDVPWTIQPNNNKLQLNIGNYKSLIFNPKQEGNAGYILNNKYIDYIDDKNMVNTEYEIPTNENNKKYNEYQTEKVTAKILLPKTYELFSSIRNKLDSTHDSYSYIDKSSDEGLLYMINGANGLVYEISKDAFYSYDTKIIITIKGNLKITSGNGTINKPYILK